MTALAQRNFSSGEIAPAYYANTNLQRYQTGLRTLRNFIINRGGGVTNRAGTEYTANTQGQASLGRLVEFSYSDVETYLLEFGNNVIRFYQMGVQLAPIGAVAWSAVSWPAGTIVTYLGITYWAKIVTGTTTPVSTPAEWYSMGLGLIMEIPSPYPAGALLMDLQFAQSKNVMTIVHPSYPVYELSRVGASAWTLLPVSFLPVSATPGGLGISSGGSAGPLTYWAVTAIQNGDFEESLPILGSAINRVPSAGFPVLITWAAGGSNDFSYNIYRSTDGSTYGYVGSSKTLSYSDVGALPDFLHSYPTGRAVFDAANKYPSAVTHYQQRRVFARSNNEPETVWGSRTAQPKNFGVTFPILDDDAVTFTMVGKRAQPVKHLLDLGILIVLTDREEKKVDGDDAGILRPDAINPRKLSANGSNKLRPIELDDTAIYVQSRGTIVRDLKPVSADNYTGTDLTVFAQHLFDGFTLVDWDFAKNPHSIIWAVRSDGVLLGLTYMRDQNVWGWHRHDTDGFVENVCVVGEGTVDTVYLIVRRVINGVTKRYIERMSQRYVTSQESMNFTDCSLLVNTWNTTATRLRIAGVTYADGELLTLDSDTSNLGSVVAGDVVILRTLDANGIETDRVRFTISTTVPGAPVYVQGYSDKAVPALLRSAYTTQWSFAKKVVTGLSFLEGKSVSVLADGYVVASPNNADYPVVTVTGGQITLPQAYAIIRVGLPFISDFQTLDLDAQGQATIKDKKLIVNRIGLYLEASRGIWIGQPTGPTAALPLKGLQEIKMRDAETYNSTVTPLTDWVAVTIESTWGSGRFLVRQVDPLPITILSATPIGYL